MAPPDSTELQQVQDFGPEHYNTLVALHESVPKGFGEAQMQLYKEVPSDDTCCICMETSGTALQLPCGHAPFCTTCGRQYLSECGTTCPLCNLTACPVLFAEKHTGDAAAPALAESLSLIHI